jgi:hypothetical protein
MGAPAVSILTVIGFILTAILFAKWYYRNDVREIYTDASGVSKAKAELNTLLDTSTFTPPYATNSIMSVDDYEYNLVFDQESDRAMTKATRDLLMSTYPMDWSNQPPSSVHFQQGKAAMLESFKNPPAPQTGPGPYVAIEGASLSPPDTMAAEQSERDILQTYTPTTPAPLTYDLNDAKALVEKLYSSKGKIAEVVKKEGADNVYEVISVRNKNEKIQYDDEVGGGADAAPASKVPVSQAGEATIVVPPAVNEYSAGLDPFFTTEQSSRVGRWDYTRWTPGLERAFAPTGPQTNWY